MGAALPFFKGEYPEGGRGLFDSRYLIRDLGLLISGILQIIESHKKSLRIFTIHVFPDQCLPAADTDHL